MSAEPVHWMTINSETGEMRSNDGTGRTIAELRHDQHIRVEGTQLGEDFLAAFGAATAMANVPGNYSLLWHSTVGSPK